MKVIRNLDNIDMNVDKGSIAVIGSFDGVHKGHRLLIQKLNELALQYEIVPFVITFDIHPLKIIRGSCKLLSTLEEKIELLEEAGTRNLVLIPFSEELRNMVYDKFLSEVLVEKLNVKYIVVGDELHFGFERGGNEVTIRNFDIETIKIGRVSDISSTVIRNDVLNGKMEEANILLGGRGYLIKTPLTDKSKILPPKGKYKAIQDDGMVKEISIPESLETIEDKRIRII